MKVLITGITGYIGSRLARRLERDGHEVRGFSRHSGSLPGVAEVVKGDAVSGAGLEQALDGVDAAYFLIHSMEPSIDGAFDVRERRGAENFARVAKASDLKRLVYLGGPAPTSGKPSPHLASRLAVEQILYDAARCSVAFRASISIGAESSSFRFLVHLIERMPLLPVPAWGVHKSAPIDERDLIELLARALTNEAVCGQSLDAGGPELLSYAELIDRIRYHMFVERPTVNFRRLNATPIVSRIAALVANADHALIGTMMESLEEDLLPRGGQAAEVLGLRLHSLDSAIERSLRDWEASEQLAAR
jgi:uncharacterized protein YbjT (DUF2867 family)